jgi:NADH:ubiquinone reductase (H+-translocating)
MKRILILGGGFAGAYAAQRLEKRFGQGDDLEVVLVSQENFILFTPMLHEVAGSDVGVTDVVQPLRKMLRRTRIVIAEVEAVDLGKRQVWIHHPDLDKRFELGYDQLVLALGAVTNFFGTPGLAEHAMTMKTLGDAMLVRNRAIDALELADNQTDPAQQRTTLTVLVAGGGFAGVETAGAVNDLLRESVQFYRRLSADLVRVVIVHPGDGILQELGASMGGYAAGKLRQRGVEILLQRKVTGYDGNEVVLDDGSRIPTRMVIWTAGIAPSSLVAGLPCKLQHGRVITDECMQVPGWPGVWALGDCALVPDGFNPGQYYPPTAQHASRQAIVLADNIAATLAGKAPRPFKFKLLGLLASIGRRVGVAQVLGMKFSGFVAWWLWRGIYLSKLPGFSKKVRVAIDWALDLVFAKDLVQLPALRPPAIAVEQKNGDRHP